MSWLSNLWSKLVKRDVLKAVKRLLLVIIGGVGNKLADLALDAVVRAEATNLSGREKFKLAYDMLRENAEFKKLPEYAIRIAIESAVSMIDPKPNN